MTTQTESEAKINKIFVGMAESGVARAQAVAVAMAIEHALACPEYAKMYGTYLQGALQEFVDVVYTS